MKRFKTEQERLEWLREMYTPEWIENTYQLVFNFIPVVRLRR